MKRFVPLAATLAILAAAPAFAAETTTTPSTGTGTTTEPVPPPAPSATTPSTTEPGTGTTTAPDSTGAAPTTPDMTTTTPGATTTPDTTTGSTMGSTPTTLSMTQEQAEAWVDKPIYSADDKNVGEVAEIARSADGEVTELRADVGGFLGLGETRVRLTPEQFQLGADRIDLKLTSEQINSLPKIETP